MTSSKRLAAVLRVRQIQERSARGQLAVRRRELRLAEIAEHRTWTDLDERAGDAVGVGVATTGSASMIGGRLVIDAGLRAAGTQRTVTESAGTEVSGAMAHWTIAARRVEGMERLADRVAANEEEERQRLANNEIDDLVLARFGRGGPGLE